MGPSNVGTLGGRGVVGGKGVDDPASHQDKNSQQNSSSLEMERQQKPNSQQQIQIVKVRKTHCFPKIAFRVRWLGRALLNMEGVPWIGDRLLEGAAAEARGHGRRRAWAGARGRRRRHWR